MPTDTPEPAPPEATPEGPPEAVVVINADSAPSPDAKGSNITDLIEQPAKVMRIGSMVKQLLEEVRSAPLDEAGRTRLKEIHSRSITELTDGLAPELAAELGRLSLPFGDAAAPSESELRIAQAQLVGWLEGLFHGIQTTIVAQQMAARVQFEELRRRSALGGGEAGPSAELPGATPADPQGPGVHGPYL